MKTLYFEGAGCEGTNIGDVENCRIRTAFTNDAGNKIYLELTGNVKTVKDEKKYKRFPEYTVGEGIGFITSCHVITDDKTHDDENDGSLRISGRISHISYTKKGILSFVNKQCNCSFDNIEVLGHLSGYRVFNGNSSRDYNGYNYGDEFIYNKELEERKIAKANELHTHFCKIFNQKFDNTSIWTDNGTSNLLHVMINVEASKRIAAGYQNRTFTVEV